MIDWPILQSFKIAVANDIDSACFIAALNSLSIDFVPLSSSENLMGLLENSELTSLPDLIFSPENELNEIEFFQPLWKRVVVKPKGNSRPRVLRWAIHKEKICHPDVLNKLEKFFDFVEKNQIVYSREWADSKMLNKQMVESYIQSSISFKEVKSQTLNKAGYLKKSLDSCLSDASRGIRPTISQAIRLAKQASLSDLGLAANIKQNNVASPTEEFKFYKFLSLVQNYETQRKLWRVKSRLAVSPSRVSTFDLLISELIKFSDAGGDIALLSSKLPPTMPFSHLEELITKLHRQSSIKIFIFGPAFIENLSLANSIKKGELLNRLNSAGVSGIIDDDTPCSIKSWTEIFARAHSLNLFSVSCSRFELSNRWEDLIYKLHRTSCLHLQTRGFSAFLPKPELVYQKAGLKHGERYLRMVALSRLFLDNSIQIQGDVQTVGYTIAHTALSYGANNFGAMRIENVSDMPPLNQEAIDYQTEKKQA
jgi:cyclic dehypoxanthinyl futalosine synthase